MVAILGANSVSGGYEVSNSLRFNDGDSPSLNRTPSGSGTTGTWTWSGWVKRGVSSTNSFVMFSSGAVNARGHIYFNSDNIIVQPFNSSGASMGRKTEAVFRDHSAWYHIVVIANSISTSNLSTNLDIYVNGIEFSTIATGSGTPSGGDRINDGQVKMIGQYAPSSGSHFDGYMSEINFIDGTAKAHTDFGEFDDNGVWIPKQYTGSYGTNGFFLEFKQTGTSQNSSGIGADTSGNDNHFAVTNLASTDITEDTCTNNFATINPLANQFNPATLSEGNTRVDFDSGVSTVYNISTIGVSSGKWYCEIKAVTIPDYAIIGIASRPCIASGNSDNLTVNQYNYGYHSNDGNVKSNSSSGVSYGATYDDGDIIGIALDLDNNKLYFSKNGTFQNSGDPTSGSTGTGAISIEAPSGTIDGFYYFAVGDNRNDHATRMDCNFGNPAFSISSGNNDGKYGNFEYSVPSGYYALCTKRLAEFG
jgi:hypothetical protein